MDDTCRVDIFQAALLMVSFVCFLGHAFSYQDLV
jgi:hypothetical protein